MNEDWIGTKHDVPHIQLNIVKLLGYTIRHIDFLPFFFFFCYDTDSPVGETCLNQCHKDNSWRENISVKFSSGKGKTV